MNGNPNPGGGFDLNRPTIISLLYLSSFFVGVTGIVALVLAIIWKGEPGAPWMSSHYQYHINTFIIGLVGSIIGALLTLVLIGFLILLAVAVLVIVRCVKSLIAAQRHEAMPNPSSWTV